MAHKTFLENAVCRYLLKDDNFKRVYTRLEKDINPIYAKAWYGPETECTKTGVDLQPGGINLRDACYIDALRFNKQSLAFYSEVLPMFYDCIVSSGMELSQEYTLLDVGARTGAGSNFLGQAFSDEKWGYMVKLLVDTTDTNPGWKEYQKLQPYIRHSFEQDIFTMEPDTYDICYCSHTIEHLDDPVAFVKQLRRIARKFAFITCPFEEQDPIPVHHTVTRQIIEQCGPKYFKTYKSVNRWKEDLECVVFAV